MNGENDAPVDRPNRLKLSIDLDALQLGPFGQTNPVLNPATRAELEREC